MGTRGRATPPVSRSFGAIFPISINEVRTNACCCFVPQLAPLCFRPSAYFSSPSKKPTPQKDPAAGKGLLHDHRTAGCFVYYIDLRISSYRHCIEKLQMRNEGKVLLVTGSPCE